MYHLVILLVDLVSGVLLVLFLVSSWCVSFWCVSSWCVSSWCVSSWCVSSWCVSFCVFQFGVILCHDGFVLMLSWCVPFWCYFCHVGFILLSSWCVILHQHRVSFSSSLCVSFYAILCVSFYVIFVGHFTPSLFVPFYIIIVCVILYHNSVCHFIS